MCTKSYDTKNFCCADYMDGLDEICYSIQSYIFHEEYDSAVKQCAILQDMAQLLYNNLEDGPKLIDKYEQFLNNTINYLIAKNVNISPFKAGRNIPEANLTREDKYRIQTICAQCDAARCQIENFILKNMYETAENFCDILDGYIEAIHRRTIAVELILDLYREFLNKTRKEILEKKNQPKTSPIECAIAKDCNKGNIEQYILIAIKNDSTNILTSLINHKDFTFNHISYCLQYAVRNNALKALDIMLKHDKFKNFENIMSVFHFAMSMNRLGMVKMIIESSLFPRTALTTSDLINYTKQDDRVNEPAYSGDEFPDISKNGTDYVKLLLSSEKFYLTSTFIEDMTSMLLPKNFEIIKFIVNHKDFYEVIKVTKNNSGKQIMETCLTLSNYLKKHNYVCKELLKYCPFQNYADVVEFFIDNGIKKLSFNEETDFSNNCTVLKNRENEKYTVIEYEENSQFSSAIEFLKSRDRNFSLNF